MKKIISIPAFLLASIFLPGCATWGQFDEGLQGLVDMPLTHAVSKLGYPNGERNVAGMRIVEWGRSQQALMPMTTSVNSFGTVSTNSGYGTYNGTTTGLTYAPVQYNCTVSLNVDQNDVVRGYQYNGNIGGCTGYIRALKR